MNQDNLIEVNFETNVQDWRRVLVWYRWKRMLIEYVLMVILGVPFLYFFGINLLDLKNNGFAAFSFFFTVITLFIFSIYFGIWRQAEKLKNIAEPAKAIFSDKGLKTISKSSSSEKTWERFSKIFETKEDFIFYLMENVFFTIPKRFFQDEKQISELKQLFRQKLGEKAN
jgi:hypothetical protein